MPHCGLRHSCCNARAAVRRARALELLESVHRPRMRAGLEVVPPTTGPGVVTLRKAQEFAERALGPRAPLGELKAAAVVRVRVPENLLAPREWRPPLRRAAGGAAQSAQHHQRCAQKPRVRRIATKNKKLSGIAKNLSLILRACLLMFSASPATAAMEICCVWWTTKEEALADAAPYTVRSVLIKERKI